MAAWSSIHQPRGLRGWGGSRGWFLATTGLRTTLAELGVPLATGSSVPEALAERDLVDGWYLAMVGFAVAVGGVIGVRRVLRYPRR